MKDGVLKVKFPREEVTDVLQSGEDVRIDVSGKTTEDVLLVGSDNIRVIDPQPISQDSSEGSCSRGNPVGPSENAHGVATGPIDCPPGHGGETRGKSIGKDGNSPGHEAESSGRSGKDRSNSRKGGQGNGRSNNGNGN